MDYESGERRGAPLTCEFLLNNQPQQSDGPGGRENDGPELLGSQPDGSLPKYGEPKPWAQENSADSFELNELTGSLETTASTVGRETSDLSLDLRREESTIASHKLSSALQDLIIEKQQRESSEEPFGRILNEAACPRSGELNGRTDSHSGRQPRTILTVPDGRLTVGPQEGIALRREQISKDVTSLHSGPRILRSASLAVPCSRFSGRTRYEDDSARSAAGTRKAGVRLESVSSASQGTASVLGVDEKLKSGSMRCPLAPRMQSQAALFCLPDLTDSEMLPEAANMLPFPRRVHSVEIPGPLARAFEIPCALNRGMSDQLEQALKKLLRGESSQGTVETVGEASGKSGP
ncbi:hypothetical protein CSUI_010613 [Cystoisospora suis]|uniref:Uncharacterized protein n=1 Tax=Cystoisospora suis TaxID=483139 RepID=A0A2C6KGW3_9APIC|nr:hypothetical protein CSUI_010613 [Cystoisospora suis]